MRPSVGHFLHEWENVPEEAADELRALDGHQPFLSGLAVVSGSEGNLAISQANQPLVGDGHPVGVAADIMIGLWEPPKALFGIDNPLFLRLSFRRKHWNCTGFSRQGTLP